MAGQNFKAQVDIDVTRAIQGLRRLQEAANQTFAQVRQATTLTPGSKAERSVQAAATGRKAEIGAARQVVSPIARARGQSIARGQYMLPMLGQAQVQNRIFATDVRQEALSAFGGRGAQMLGHNEAIQYLQRIAVAIEREMSLTQAGSEGDITLKLIQGLRELDISIEVLTRRLSDPNFMRGAAEKSALQQSMRRRTGIASYEYGSADLRVGEKWQTEVLRKADKARVDQLHAINRAYEKGGIDFQVVPDAKRGFGLRSRPGMTLREQNITRQNFVQKAHAQAASNVLPEDVFDKRTGKTKTFWRDAMTGMAGTPTADQLAAHNRKLQDSIEDVTKVEQKSVKTKQQVNQAVRRGIRQLPMYSAGLKSTGTQMAFLRDMSQGAQLTIQKLSSAMQGFMLGLAAANRDVMGLAFSLIFLHFAGFGKLALVIAGVTFAGMEFMRVFKRMMEARKEIELMQKTFFTFSRNFAGMEQAQHTAQTITAGLDISVGKGDFEKAIVEAQKQLVERDIDFNLSDLTMFTQMFAIAFTRTGQDIDQALQQVIPSFLSFMKEGDETALVIDNIQFSLKKLAEDGTAHLAYFTKQSDYTVEEAIHLFRKFGRLQGLNDQAGLKNLMETPALSHRADDIGVFQQALSAMEGDTLLMGQALSDTGLDVVEFQSLITEFATAFGMESELLHAEMVAVAEDINHLHAQMTTDEVSNWMTAMTEAQTEFSKLTPGWKTDLQSFAEGFKGAYQSVDGYLRGIQFSIESPEGPMNKAQIALQTAIDNFNALLARFNEDKTFSPVYTLNETVVINRDYVIGNITGEDKTWEPLEDVHGRKDKPSEDKSATYFEDLGDVHGGGELTPPTSNTTTNNTNLTINIDVPNDESEKLAKNLAEEIKHAIPAYGINI